MIFESIKNIDNYKKNIELYKVLCYLKNLNGLPSPNTILKENSIFCNPVCFTTKTETECLYEAHKNFIDVHYILKGSEKIATADTMSLISHTPYDTDKDIAFYTGTQFGSYILNKGDFMICFPSDAHKVAIAPKNPDAVEKIVVKIKVGTI